MPYSVVHEGVFDEPTYQLSASAERAIRGIREVSNLPPADMDKLLQGIERAIGWAQGLKGTSPLGRKELLGKIKVTAKLAAHLMESLEHLVKSPHAGSFFREQGFSLANTIRFAERVHLACETVAPFAEKTLKGRGETPKGDIQDYLCCDIAKVLQAVGIKVTVARPKTVNNKGGPYLQIVKICLGEMGLHVADPYKHLVAGKKMLELRSKN